MNAPRSRALARLDAAIAEARGPVEEACLMAERAGLLARLGHVEEVRDILAELRRRQAQLVHPALSAWLALAEGLAEHYRDQSATARDRIRRAYALAVASRNRPLIALGAAWHAHTDYVYGDLPAMARHVAESLQEAAADHHAARARACLVAAQSYHWGGRPDRATPWYQRSREHAVADGDESTLSSLMINRAWIGGNQARLASIFGAEVGDVDEAAVREALFTAESSRNFDSHVGRQSLRSMVELIHAQLVLVQGDHAGALARLEATLSHASADGFDFMSPVLHADMAWCKAQLGRADAALADARCAEQGFTDDCEEEDRAAAHGRLAQVFAKLGLAEDAARHHAESRAQLAALRVQQARIVELLDDALRQVPGLR